MAMTIGAGEFKARCLRPLDLVAQGHEEVIITKRGRPVARLVPVRPHEDKLLFGAMAGSVARQGDLISPIDEQWDADEGKPAYGAVLRATR